jgi:hypothetical protein
MTPATTHDFDGATYAPLLDKHRLNSQLRAVWDVLCDGEPHTVDEMQARGVKGRESGITARIRDFRKPEFGAFEIESKRVSGGTYTYRLVIPKPVGEQMRLQL